MGNVQWLDLSNNSFNGTLPVAWATSELAVTLQTLLLDNNQLAGSISSEWTSMTALRCWSLRNNTQLCGNVLPGTYCPIRDGTNLGKCPACQPILARLLCKVASGEDGHLVIIRALANLGFTACRLLASLPAEHARRWHQCSCRICLQKVLDLRMASAINQSVCCTCRQRLRLRHTGFRLGLMCAITRNVWSVRGATDTPGCIVGVSVVLGTSFQPGAPFCPVTAHKGQLRGRHGRGLQARAMLLQKCALLCAHCCVQAKASGRDGMKQGATVGTWHGSAYVPDCACGVCGAFAWFCAEKQHSGFLCQPPSHTHLRLIPCRPLSCSLLESALAWRTL
jgi:hypothetical protein